MFSFKEFSVSQERCAMKVGTDGVVLGAWAALSGAETNILDIGSGTGLVALMMAQRSGAQIVGVEIDSASYEQSLENVVASPWSERIVIINSAIQDYHPATRYDLVVSNPPFFRSSLKSPNASRTTARHNDSLSLKDLAAAAARLLTADGRFVVVLPKEESHSLDIEACGELYLSRRCALVTERGKEAKRYLSEYTLKPTTQIVNEALTIRVGGEYSEEYRALTAQFYREF